MLSSPLEFIVSGSTSQQTSQQRQENTAATGSPTISGTVQVGQTLAASTTGIALTPTGTTNASYSYQWIVNDGTSDSDIADATVSAYTLVAGDAGKMIKVRVSFTDDAGNEETLTSVATVAVARNRAGRSGHPQRVGERHGEAGRFLGCSGQQWRFGCHRIQGAVERRLPIVGTPQRRCPKPR